MIAPASASSDLEFIFHGTGCSSALPYATCLTTSLTNPSGIACRSCRETIDGTPEGGKNTRGNTGGVIRKRTDDGKEWRNVVIDVGKTFRENSVRYFRGLGVDRIDAVVLTHGHTDAIAGLGECFSQHQLTTTVPNPHPSAHSDNHSCSCSSVSSAYCAATLAPLPVLLPLSPRRRSPSLAIPSLPPCRPNYLNLSLLALP